MKRSSRQAKKRGDVAVPAEALGRKDYEAALDKLHVRLVQLQEWVVAKGLKVCIVFEGRDGAAPPLRFFACFAIRVIAFLLESPVAAAARPRTRRPARGAGSRAARAAARARR